MGFKTHFPPSRHPPRRRRRRGRGLRGEKNWIFYKNPIFLSPKTPLITKRHVSSYKKYQLPKTHQIMSLRLGDIAPNFTAQTSQGEINFHEWLGDSWGMLFLTPNNQSSKQQIHYSINQSTNQSCTLFGVVSDIAIPIPT